MVQEIKFSTALREMQFDFHAGVLDPSFENVMNQDPIALSYKVKYKYTCQENLSKITKMAKTDDDEGGGDDDEWW